MLFSLSQMKYFLYHWVSFPAFFPANLSFLTLILLLAIGIALIFKGDYSWKMIFAILGAYFGFIFAHYLSSVIGTGSFPSVLVYIIGAVIGAILMTFFVRIFLSLAFAYLSYMILQTLFANDFIVVVLAALVIFVMAYLLYNKIIIGIAGVIGAAAVWFSLISIGLPNIPAQLIAGILFAVGIYLQLSERKRMHRRGPNRYHDYDYDRDPGWYER